ncbi:hypothetical protein FIBSPDRAFT_847178 [Athelia psychrophila]|uniref:F-box domain-containing protein n=1 Tax=Athelia psychrophila TaxID=1759441 RepID=A0A166WRT0_9AGAM|nr:hypothetical protein FIBSPDRAFT_869216 [Fibularhizoctonia sp. CBS 109695]KZP34039.1 hypothetical protein FIBSPDRAFT_847178 [Fibularhizoctonia sp. CBS 109695]
MNLYDMITLDGCLASLQVNAPMLTNARIVLQHSTTHRLLSGFGLKTELLSRIELRGVSFPCYQNVSLRRLTSLSLTEVVANLHHTQFTSLLAQAPEIEQLSIFGDVVSMGGSSPSPLPIIPIPSLKALTLLPGSLFNFRHLSNSLVTPAIEELSLHHLDADSMGAFMQSFHSDDSKYPMLRSLELRAPIAFPDATPTFLTAFPSITHLSLVAYRPEAHAPVIRALALARTLKQASETRYCGYPSIGVNLKLQDDFDQVAYEAVPVHICPTPIPEVSIALLPNLKSLGVAPLSEDVFIDLRKVISDRAEAGAPIQTLKSSTYDRLSQQNYTWLRERVSLGAI